MPCLPVTWPSEGRGGPSSSLVLSCHEASFERIFERCAAFGKLARDSRMTRLATRGTLGELPLGVESRSGILERGAGSSDRPPVAWSNHFLWQLGNASRLCASATSPSGRAVITGQSPPSHFLCAHRQDQGGGTRPVSSCARQIRGTRERCRDAYAAEGLANRSSVLSCDLN